MKVIITGFLQNNINIYKMKNIKLKHSDQEYFKAAVLEQINKPIKIRNIRPNVLKRGQVFVKILFSGLCRSQLMEVLGKRGEDQWLPHLLGHEGVGEVINTGKGVKKVKKGDQVILSWIKSKGINAENPKYNYKKNNNIINAGKITTLSQFTVVSENRLVKKPKKLKTEEAILFGCAVPTGAGMVVNQMKIKKNSTIVVLGLGGIGLISLLTLISYKLKKIIVIDKSQKKLNKAKEWGIKFCFKNLNSKTMTKITNITNGGADFCIESAGQSKTIEFAFGLINKNHGKLIFASHPPEEEYIKIKPHDLILGKKIIGSWGGSTTMDRDINIFYKILSASKISLGQLLTKRYKLSQINKALKDLKQGKVFRPLIDMDH